MRQPIYCFKDGIHVNFSLVKHYLKYRVSQRDCGLKYIHKLTADDWVTVTELAFDETGSVQ